MYVILISYGVKNNKLHALGKSIRWDLGAIDELPSYLRIVIQSIVETMEDINRELKPRGRSSSVQYTVEEVR